MNWKLERKSGRTFLPDSLLSAHEACFLNHDIMAELLRAGEEDKVFNHNIVLQSEEERKSFDNSKDVFDWLEQTGRQQDRAELLRRVVFPALLSDLLHFIYEALESARKAKLNVAYALIRKPLQENLFLFETIASEPDRFAAELVQNPLLLRGQKAGGLEVHTNRISAVLRVLKEEDRFDAAYLAQLRYDKSDPDSFDGVCNHAIHLFTEHKAIRTEPMNINFIFSGWDEKTSQWNYLYSRLPYVLFYTRRLVEYVCSTFAVTDPVYFSDVERRIEAATLWWAPDLPEGSGNPAINKFLLATDKRLTTECQKEGYRKPNRRDLDRMRLSGAWPGESRLHVLFRQKRRALNMALWRSVNHQGS